MLTIAVIYDRPECAWITDGGIHFDVLHIAEEEPVGLHTAYSATYP